MGFLQLPLSMAVNWVDHLCLSSGSLFVCLVGFWIMSFWLTKCKDSDIKIWKEKEKKKEVGII